MDRLALLHPGSHFIDQATGDGMLWTRDQVARIAALSWDAGRWYERYRIAEGYAEIDACWRPIGRMSYEDRVAARLVEMERCAQRRMASGQRPAGYSGSGTYAGGPVDWETGAPLRSTEAAT